MEESEALIVDMSLCVADWASTLTALHLAGMDVARLVLQLKGLTVADTAALIGKLRPILTPAQFAEEVLPKLKLTKVWLFRVSSERVLGFFGLGSLGFMIT